MKKVKRMLPYLLIMFAGFMILPLFIKDTVSGMFILLFIMPAFCFVVSFLYGFKGPFTYFYPLAAAVLFLPSIPIYFNSSAAVYTVSFGVISLIGSYLAHFFDKKLH